MNRPRRGFASARATAALAWILFLIFGILPFILAIGLSLTSFTPVANGRPTVFIGLDNFSRLVTDRAFLSALSYTGRFAFVSSVLEISVGLAIGMWLSSRPSLARFALPPLLVVSFLPPITVALVAKYVLQPSFGLLAQVRGLFGSPEGISVLGDAGRAFWAFVLIEVWWASPLLMMLFFFACQRIPRNLFAANTMDGGARLEALKTIVIPALRPLLLVVFLLRFLEGFRVFELSYLLTGGGPGHQTEVLQLYIWRMGFRLWQTSYASALGLFVYVAVSLLLLVLLKPIKRVLQWS